jgi:AcrR family transcriptional regulator
MNEGSNLMASERVRLRNEARRSEILRAAARVFRRLGLAGAGMREIADEAGLSPGNLYHYFSGKDQILLFCQERTLERLLDAVDQGKRADASAADRLRQVLREHVHAMLDDLDGATAHLEVEALPQALRAPVIAKRDAYERALRSIVTQGVARGEFAPCDAALVTRAMLGAVNWSARWYRPEGAKSPRAIADALADYLVKGLLASPLVTGAASAAVKPPLARRAALSGADR